MGYSVRELSERTERFGHLVPRQAIVNLEAGRKASLGVDDLFMLAHALAMNPLHAVYDPMAQGAPVEVLPNLNVPTWEALEWASVRDSVLDTIYGIDIDGAKHIVKMRSRLDAVRERIAGQEERLGEYQARFTELDGDAQETTRQLMDGLRTGLDAMRSEEASLVHVLERLAVQMNDSWFSSSAVRNYTKKVWFADDEPSS